MVKVAEAESERPFDACALTLSLRRPRSTHAAIRCHSACSSIQRSISHSTTNHYYCCCRWHCSSNVSFFRAAAAAFRRCWRPPPPPFDGSNRHLIIEFIVAVRVVGCWSRQVAEMCRFWCRICAMASNATEITDAERQEKQRKVGWLRIRDRWQHLLGIYAI